MAHPPQSIVRMTQLSTPGERSGNDKIDCWRCRPANRSKHYTSDTYVKIVDAGVVFLQACGNGIHQYSNEENIK